MPSRPQRHHRGILRIVLSSHAPPPSESWTFTIVGQRGGGRFFGSLIRAGHGALMLARDAGFHSVDLTLPRAGLFGWRARRFLITRPADLAQLSEVDVDLLAARHRVECRGSVQRSSWQHWLADAVAGLGERMPVVWAAVP